MIDSQTPLLRCPHCGTDLSEPVIGLLVNLSIYRERQTPKPPALFANRPASADSEKAVADSSTVTGGVGDRQPFEEKE
jgi:hypothetical protein